jgi:hypothetical protein
VQAKRDWSVVSDEELIAQGRAYEEPGACKKADSGLHLTINKRKLSAVVWPAVQAKRNWSGVSDKELIAQGRVHKGPRACMKADSGLEAKIRERKLSAVVWPGKTHTLESATAVALKYKTRNEFKACAGGEYQWAAKNKHLDVVCAHMPRRVSRKKKPA